MIPIVYPDKRRSWLFGGALLISMLIIVSTLTAPLTPNRVRNTVLPVGGKQVEQHFIEHPELADHDRTDWPIQFRRATIIYRPLWYLVGLLFLPQAVGWILGRNWVSVYCVVSLCLLIVIHFIFVSECRMIQTPLLGDIYILYTAVVLSRKSDEAFASPTLKGLAFVMPNFIGFLLFSSLPVIASIVFAFLQCGIITPPRWIGLNNFAKLIEDAKFWRYGWNTVFMMAAIPPGMLGSLFLAVVLNHRIRGVTFFRAVFFLPSVASGIALLILWSWIYNPDFGLINSMLAAVGIVWPRWFTDIHWVKPALMIMSFWTGVGGYNMILYLAALQNINPKLYEAADIDGSSSW